MITDPKRTRLSLDLDNTSNGRLEELQDRLGHASKTEVIRRALTLLDMLTEYPRAKVQITIENETETIRFL